MIRWDLSGTSTLRGLFSVGEASPSRLSQERNTDLPNFAFCSDNLPYIPVVFFSLKIWLTRLLNINRNLTFRYLTKFKHWSWKWWDEDPQDHQISPLFDVIRIFRFKQRMKGEQILVIQVRFGSLLLSFFSCLYVFFW